MAIIRGILLAVTMSALLACSDEQAPQAAAGQQPAAGPPPAAEAQAEVHRGRVVSHTAAGAYSYIEVDAGGRTVWLAANRLQLEPGTEISWGSYAVMANFHSKALGRTFEQILFVSSVSAPGAAGAAGAAADTSGKALTVMNSGGYTYIEVQGAGGGHWLAVPEAKVEQGDTVRWSGGTTMRNFSSSSLNRTFDEIVFAGSVQVVD